MALKKLRTKFWVTKPRSFIRQFIQNCVINEHFYQKLYSYPESPALPNNLYTAHIHWVTGCDYTAPGHV